VVGGLSPHLNTTKENHMGRKSKPERPSPFYSMLDLMGIFGVSDRSLWKWIAAGKLPEPIRKSRKWVRWPRHVIDSIVADWSRQGGPA